MNKEITIIDAPCGYGKSSYAIQMINDDIYQEKKYIYVTPYLDEVERIKTSIVNREFFAPESKKGDTKINDLLSLLQSGANIVTTHSLFQNINDEIINAIYENNYVLILDEVAKVVEKIKLKKGDIDILINSGAAIFDKETKYIHWNEEYKSIELSIKEFQRIRSCALYGKLMAYEDARGEVNAIIWNFPAKVFEVFKEVYILTYLFKGQLQKYYFDLHDIRYNFKSVKKVNDIYSLVDYHDRIHLDKSQIKQLINLYDETGSEEKYKANDMARSLSFNACTQNAKSAKPILKRLSKDAYNVFQNVFKAKKDEVMWTMYVDAVKKFKFNIKGYKGYVDTDNPNCFIAHNVRATNNYKNRSTVGYLIERNLDNTYKIFFRANSVKVDEDIWRLSEMIQFIWRSAIRENNPINLYIPSKRMRDLFKKWLNSDEFEEILEQKQGAA